jgi:hypothetical protein
LTHLDILVTLFERALLYQQVTPAYHETKSNSSDGGRATPSTYTSTSSPKTTKNRRCFNFVPAFIAKLTPGITAQPEPQASPFSPVRAPHLA